MLLIKTIHPNVFTHILSILLNKYKIHITNIFPKLTNSNIIGPKCFTTSRAQILCKEEISKVRNIYKYVLIE